MKEEEKIKEFKRIHGRKYLDVDKNLMPIIRDPIPPNARTTAQCKKKILNHPECRTALAIMIKEYGILYFHKVSSEETAEDKE